MIVLDTITKRRSVRKFQNEPLSQEILDQLVEALRWAPSAGNLQSRKFFFVSDRQLKNQLTAAACHQGFISEAPLVVVACADQEKIATRYGQRGIDLYCICDVACSVQNMMLVANELGLGSVWVGAFAEDEVANLLRLPENLRPIAIVPVGYSAEYPVTPPRVPLDEVVSYWERGSSKGR